MLWKNNEINVKNVVRFLSAKIDRRKVVILVSDWPDSPHVDSKKKTRQSGSKLVKGSDSTVFFILFNKDWISKKGISYFLYHFVLHTW